jgi:hypothetical protein
MSGIYFPMKAQDHLAQEASQELKYLQETESWLHQQLKRV